MSSLKVEVCKIDDVYKHPNADKLSIAVIKGWNCIIGLDQFKIGDLVVFIPPDSIVPAKMVEEYNLTYLKSKYEDGSAKIGSQKLRGYLSQGLLIGVPNDKNFKEGDDVAEYFGIKKWQPPTPQYQNYGKVTPKKLNPLFDKFTDIENIKHYNDIFKVGDKIYISEKIHGTNARYSNLPIFEYHPNFFKRLWNKIKMKFTDGYEFCYGSHNVQLGTFSKNKSYYDDNVYALMIKKYDLKNKVPKDYILYSEIYGAGIQDLTYGLKEVNMAVIGVKKDGKYLPYEQLKQFCEEKELPIVPLLYIGEYYDGVIEEYTNGMSTICPTQIREGCVVVDYNEINDPRIGRKILKSVSEAYLTRKNGTEYH